LDFLQRHIEALVFCSPSPIKQTDIQACLTEMFDNEVPEEDVQSALEALKARYSQEDYAMEIIEAGGGYQFMTKPAYQASIAILLKQSSRRRLSTSAMETLSIVAYKQPVTKSQVEQIRGVNCDYAIKKLLEKGLLEIKGKSEGVGRPVIYGTSEKFLEYFGISDLTDLPEPKDFSEEENEIGDHLEAANDGTDDQEESK